MRGPRRTGEPVGLGQVLASLLRERPWGSGMALGELGRRWASVVGERLAQECHPVRLEAGALMVQASSAAWAVQLKFLANDIRDRANTVLGADRVQEVKVSVGGPPAGRSRGRG